MVQIRFTSSYPNKYDLWLIYKEVSELKWVNPDAIKYGVNSLRLQIIYIFIYTF